MTKQLSILVLIILASVGFCFGQSNPNSPLTTEKQKDKTNTALRKDMDGSILTELTLKDIDGNIHTLESLKGKVVVLNFWFIQCKPCVAEIPDLNKLKAKFKGKPVLFFGVALDSKASLDPFLETHPFDFTIIPKGFSLANRFKIPHYPYNVIIDQNGSMQYVSDVLSLNIMNRLKRKINGLLKD